MKKAIIIGAALAVIAFVMGFVYIIQGTQQGELKLLRTTASEDPNTAINSVAITNETAGDWDSRPTLAQGLKMFEPPNGTNQTTKKYMAVMACARGAADKTFTTNFWIWFKDKGPAIKAYSIAWTTGTQKVVKYPHNGTTVSDAYWADSGTVTAGLPMDWDQNTDGTNNVKIVIFDVMGADAVYTEVTSADGTTGTEAKDVTVYSYFLD